MLDVHPPHEAAHTWKDFLIHIATIVVGLLIAIGLEQSVEYFHHRRQAREAREMLLQEMESNRQIVAGNVYSLRLHEKHLLAALTALAHLRSHSVQPGDVLITDRPWHPVAVSAWKTARGSSAAQYLSSSEQSQFDLANWNADLFNAASLSAMVALGRATMLINYDRLAINPNRRTASSDDIWGRHGEAAAELAYASVSPHAQQLQLTPEQIDRLEQSIQSALYDDESLLNTCRNLRTGYDRIASSNK